MSKNNAYQAAADGDMESLKGFLSTGFNIIEGDKDKYTVLHWAAQEGHEEMVRFLVGSGADIDAVDFQDFTPLEVAINNGHTEIAEFLLEKSNDFSEHSKGYTALHSAAAKGDVKILNLLIEKKFPIDKQEKEGEGYTPLHWAVQEAQEECVRLLIKNGANIKMKTFSGATPLYIACGEGNAGLADYLIQQGANVNEQVGQDDQTTPMMLASMYNYPQVVEVLLKYEGDMEIKDEEGKTALFHAAETDSKEVIKLLLENGAKKTIVSKSGKKLTDILNGDQNNNNGDFEEA